MEQIHTRRRALVAATALAAMVVGAGTMLRADAQPVPPPTEPTDELVFVSVEPERILDTRNGNGDPRPTKGQKIGAGQSIDLDVRGRALVGGQSVPETAVAVMVNATITEASERTFVTFHPAGTPRPEASSLNAVFGQNLGGLGSEDVPNMITVRIGDNGGVAVFNFAGATHVLADIAGYFVPAQVAGGTPVVAGDEDPTGACDDGDVFLNTTSGQLFTCEAGAFVAGSALGAADADVPEVTNPVTLDTAATPVTVGTFTAPVDGDYLLDAVVDLQITGAGNSSDVECSWAVGATPLTFGETLDVDAGDGRATLAAEAHATELLAGDEVDFACTATTLTGTVTANAALSGVRVLTA